MRPALHGQTMFFDQEKVDKFVESYGATKLSISKVSIFLSVF